MPTPKPAYILSLPLLLCGWSLSAAEEVGSWQVLRHWRPETFRLIEIPQYRPADLPPATAPGWVDWEASRGHAYRLANPYQTGLPVWLAREIDLPADASGRTYVLAVKRGQALLNPGQVISSWRMLAKRPVWCPSCQSSNGSVARAISLRCSPIG
jgi:hypothetical protein